MEIIIQLLNGLPAELAVFILSMLPVIELRGALPVALLVYKMPIEIAFFWVILGNMVPAFLILFAWDKLINFAEGYWPWLHRTMTKIEAKTQGKWDKKIERYGPWALALFVAIPLPMSGVWTGSLAAWIFRISKARALLSVFIGVVLAAVIVSLLTLGGLQIL